jgi:hypothetical protein
MEVVIMVIIVCDAEGNEGTLYADGKVLQERSEYFAARTIFLL